MATIDIERGACMDFNSDAGFAKQPQTDVMGYGLLSFKTMCSDFSHVRLVMWVIMQQTVNSVNLIGPSCSSWGLPNRGTSMRNFINWKGNEQYPYVADANRMVSRSFGFSVHLCFWCMSR